MFAILYPFILTLSVDIHSKYHWVTVLWFAEDSIATIPDHTPTRQIYYPEKQDLRCVKSPIKINMDRHYFSSVFCRFSVFRVAFCLIGVLTGMVFIYSQKGQNLYGQKSILNSLKARSVYFEKGLMEVVGESIGKKNNEKGTK